MAFDKINYNVFAINLTCNKIDKQWNLIYKELALNKMA